MLSTSEKQILFDTIEVKLEQLGITKSCVNCAHFDHKKEVCELTYATSPSGRRPPARVIAKGCEHHEKEIPF